MPNVTVVRTYLELRSLGDLRPALSGDPHLRLVRHQDDVGVFRELYRRVGSAFNWRDRNAMSDEALERHFRSPAVQLWVLYSGDAAAGFFELQRHADDSVEIAYFGLTASFFGRGLGKHLLTVAARAAWSFGAERVWLHTCTLDSPAALPNYLARGFEPYKVETYETSVDTPPDA